LSVLSNLSSMLGVDRVLELRGTSTPISFSDVYGRGLDLFGGGSNTASGKPVTTTTALEVSTVFACVRILSESVATLPLDTMRRNNGIPQPVRPRPEWLSFNQGPWNKIEISGMIMMSLLLEGNAYVATVRDGMGVIQWLDVLDPDKVTPSRNKDGTISFAVRQVNGSEAHFSEMDIKLIRGMMLPGSLTGLSPINYARETIGLSRAATEFGAAFFGNGAVPGSTIEVPNDLSEVGAKILRDTWEQAHRGVGNSSRLAVLTEGAKFSKVTVNPDEAQFLQTREFQVPDIARFYGVPLHMLAQEGPQLGSTTSEIGQAFVQHSLRPWIERLEAAFTDLMALDETMPSGTFVRLNVDSLMRGNHADRISTYSVAVTQGIYTINEVRKWEGLKPVEWGDTPISVQVQEEEGAASESDGSGGGSPQGPSEAETNAAANKELVAAVQKIYLGVGTVVSADEAREILSRMGADLEGSLPEPEPAPSIVPEADEAERSEEEDNE